MIAQRWTGRRWGLALGAIVAMIGFLLQGRTLGGLGFPLDDAWIHQTIGRNLAQYGEWSFQLGRPGSGSTSPAWTTLIAIGHRLGVDPRFWAYALGAVFLILGAAWAAAWIEERNEKLRGRGWLLGLLLVGEWHMIWGALSGMETLLLTITAIGVLRELDRSPLRLTRIGVWIGVGMWVRPEALLLLGAAAWRIAWGPGVSARHLLRLGWGMFLPVVAYLAFHLVVVGEPWPSTFFAKPAEYAVERAEPILARWAEQAGPPLTAIGWILLPGVLLAIRSAIRDRSIGRLAPLAWILLHWTAYAVRLPVNYQHGRYAMPTIPILLLVGMEGLHGWIAAEPPWRRILGRAWIGSAIAGSAVFWWLGGRAYAIDVAVIETEMVAASRWIADHTEVEARIAAHDIGALGYFGGREILDLAGLVSPEVIPFLRDETRLAAYLDAHGADYLMTFPGWYPALVERGERVFTTRATASPAAGGENMAVYRWRLAGVAEGLSPMLYSASEPARRAWNPLAY